MPMDLGAVGIPSEPFERSWTSKDTLLYALGVGAGAEDPLDELNFTTENSRGIEQQALPTFGVLIAQAPRARSAGNYDPAQLVHAEQEFILHSPLPPTGTVRTISTVTGIYDQGSGALVASESIAVDADTGQPAVTSRTSAFIRGEGGFGGVKAARTAWELPDRAPDLTADYPTRPDQALLYRLSGDRNPLHSDPLFAAKAGFSRPILHGLCTYGIAGRLMLHALCDGDATRFLSMSGRFSRPVTPGDRISVAVWTGHEDEETGTPKAQFQVRLDDGTVVIDRGTIGFR